MKASNPTAGKRLFSVWLAGLCLLGLELGGMLLAREFASPAANPTVELPDREAEGGEAGRPFNDVLLFPLI